MARPFDDAEAVRAQGWARVLERHGHPVLTCAARQAPRFRASFASILRSVKSGNLERLKDRAFAANDLAETLRNGDRVGCHRIKDRAISSLLILDAAFINSVTIPLAPYHEPEISISFVGGGQLQTRVSLLSPEAQAALRNQLTKVPKLAALLFWLIDSDRQGRV